MDNEQRNDERENLEALIASPGWAIFQRRVIAEWRGEGYFARMGTAVATDDPLGAKIVHGVSLEIERMLKWPAARITALTTKKERKVRVRTVGRGATPND